MMTENKLVISGWLNLLFLQWFFIRLVLVDNSFRFVFPVLPLSPINPLIIQKMQVEFVIQFAIETKNIISIVNLIPSDYRAAAAILLVTDTHTKEEKTKILRELMGVN